MIAAHLSGNLGNQLFQYSLGRNLALKNKVNLILDTSDLEIPAGSKSELELLQIDAQFSKNFVKKNGAKVFYHPLGMLSLLSFFSKDLRLIEERKQEFDCEVLDCQNNIYIQGNWGNEKYFGGIENILRNELSLPSLSGTHAPSVAAEIMATNSVSLILTKNKFSNSALCNSKIWIESAIQFINTNSSNTKLFIFYEDKAELDLYDFNQKDYCNLIPSFEFTQIEILTLLSLCKNHVISEDPLGWWAAWLSKPTKDGITLINAKWMSLGITSTSPHKSDDWLIL